MFVKKDERKIPQILADACAQAHDPNLSNTTELRLARRPAEFHDGSISILTQPQYAPALHDLSSLSLYDCGITTLDGIGYFAEDKEESERRDDTDFSVRCSKLKELSLGRNPLVSLPPELAALGASLTSLWLDDCMIAGPLPDCLYGLENLETLRVSNNKITSLKGGPEDGVMKWRNMRVICLDGNMIEEVPDEFTQLTHLESLLLRKNKLKSLPEGVPGPTHPNLTLLHVSSNNLTSLPTSITQCVSLTSIYANTNDISDIPSGLMAENLNALETCNLSNNRIRELEMGWLERFGDVDLTTGLCEKDLRCKVNLDQNPIVIERRNALSPSSSPSKSKKNGYGVSMDAD